MIRRNGNEKFVGAVSDWEKNRNRSSRIRFVLFLSSDDGSIALSVLFLIR